MYQFVKDKVLAFLSPLPAREELEEYLQQKGYTPCQREEEDLIALALYYAYTHYPQVDPFRAGAFAILVDGHTTGLFSSFGPQCDALESEAEAHVFRYLGGKFDPRTGMGALPMEKLQEDHTETILTFLAEYLLGDREKALKFLEKERENLLTQSE